MHSLGNVVTWTAEGLYLLADMVDAAGRRLLSKTVDG